MHTKIRRAAVAAVVAAAFVGSSLAMATVSSAAPLDNDPNFVPSIHSNTTYRIAGNDRISTAILASQTRTDWGCNVVLARYDDFADALSAGPLADVLNAPILTNPSSGLDSRVANEINRLGNTTKCDGVNVHVIGGTGALSEAVSKAVAKLSGVSGVLRYQGSDRYQTSVAVSVATINLYTSLNIRDVNVFLATGRDFADAMTAGASAAQANGVVLLTAGSSVPAQTRSFLDNLRNLIPGTPANIASIYTVGGAAAMAWPDSDMSFVGVDRYQTASKLADHFFNWKGNISSTQTRSVGIASGWTYADAVVAAGYMANADGPLLLTNPNVLNGFTKDYLVRQQVAVNHAFVFGGSGTIAPSVTGQVSKALSF